MSRLWHRIWRGAARLDVAAAVVCALVALLAVGSTLPQAAAGAVQFFGSPLMLVPWAVLLAATLLCTLHRWRGVWRGVTAVASVAPHPPDLSGAAPHPPTPSPLAERGIGGEVSPPERSGPARLATLVTHLSVFLLLAGVLLNTQLGWRIELTVPPGATVEVGHGSGLRVAIDGFEIERYPDGGVADYVAALQVQNTPATLRLNTPVVRDGVGFYLRGYQTLPDGAALTLSAAYDPGYTLIVVAGFLLFAGMAVTFTFPAGRLKTRPAPGGEPQGGGEPC